MVPRRVWMVAPVFVVMLTIPRVAHAGIGEFIWEMSGPQMWGGGVQCKYSLKWELKQCYVTVPIPAIAKAPAERFRFSIDGGLYVSTGKDADGVDYEAWKTWMLAFDPMIEFVTWEKTDRDINQRRELYHGIGGVSYNFLFGPDFRRFSNLAFKVRPIGYRYGRFAFEFDLRMYPDGFTAGQFGKASLSPEDPDKAEVTYGFSLGIAFGDGR
jgi:hypothetical protein